MALARPGEADLRRLLPWLAPAGWTVAILQTALRLRGLQTLADAIRDEIVRSLSVCPGLRAAAVV